jgi:heterotetrameric sarcosine oxidase gamma subunit
VGGRARLRRRLEAVATETGEFVSVVDLTHGRALVRLRGAASPDLLAMVCAVDLDDRVTPNGAAFRSSVARLVTDVVRDDTGQVRSYLLHCERSSGQYLADSLLDAGAEFGIGVDRFMPPGI